MDRMMTRSYILCFLLLLSGSASAEKIQWNGKYVYEFSFGETTPDVVAVVEYALILNGNNCWLRVQGYQVNDDIICRAEVVEDSVKVRFVSYSNGSVENVYGVQLYKINEILFALIGDASGGARTQWGSLKPDEKLPSVGQFFQKAEGKN